MDDTQKYLFYSERLGFRNWLTSDIDFMAEINADAEVMKFFPNFLSKNQTIEFIERKKKQFEENKFCYFAVEKRMNQEFIGFIGLSEQKYEAEFTPCVDIGWRLHRNAWNNGFATEGAKRCLVYAFEDLKLQKVNAIAPIINKKSVELMMKIGMIKQYDFIHPLLLENETLKNCVLFQKTNPNQN